MREENESASKSNPPVHGGCNIRIAARPVISLPKYHKSKSVVPAGEYEVRVETACLRRAKSGREMIEMELSIEGFRRWFRDYLVFDERCDWKIADFLTSMGEELTDEMEIDPNNYIGRTARVRVGVREFNNRLQNYVERWLPPAGAAAKGIESEPPAQPTNHALGDGLPAESSGGGGAS